MKGSMCSDKVAQMPPLSTCRPFALSLLLALVVDSCLRHVSFHLPLCSSTTQTLHIHTPYTRPCTSLSLFFMHASIWLSLPLSLPLSPLLSLSLSISVPHSQPVVLSYRERARETDNVCVYIYIHRYVHTHPFCW